MSQINFLISQNEKYASNFKDGSLALPPSKKIAVLACMDARLLVNEVLGLKIGESHVIRNAGGIATDDAIRSLIISHELLGTEEFIVINHTDCGMVTFKDDDLKKNLSYKYNSDTSNLKFYSFNNIEDNVKEQVKKIRSHPLIPKEISISGLVYDVTTGKVKQIV